MAVIRRHVPQNKTLTFTQHAAPRRKVAEAITADELRNRLRGALPDGSEINPDGSSYLATIAKYKKRVRNPMTAIRAKCVECSGGSIKEVTECRVVGCPLYLFRTGHNPFHSRSKIRQEADAEENAGDEE